MNLKYLLLVPNYCKNVAFKKLPHHQSLRLIFALCTLCYNQRFDLKNEFFVELMFKMLIS